MQIGNIDAQGNIVMNQNDITGIGVNSRDVSNMVGKASTRTVTLNSSMSVSEIQALINAEEKFIDAGAQVMIDFTAGTYNFGTEYLKFDGFHGSGLLTVMQSGGSAALNTSQTSIINGSSVYSTLWFRECTCQANVVALKIVLGSASAGAALRFRGCTFVRVRGCYIVGHSPVTGVGYDAECSRGGFYANYVSNVKKGFAVTFSCFMQISTNDSIGTNPAYGIYNEASTVMTGGTNPTGSTANEFTTAGGVTR